MDVGFKKDSVRVSAAVRKGARKVRIRTACVEEELKMEQASDPGERRDCGILFV